MGLTQRRVQDNQSCRDVVESNMGMSGIGLINRPPRGRGERPLQRTRRIAGKSHVSADAVEDGEDFGVRFLGKAAAEREFPVEELEVCFGVCA